MGRYFKERVRELTPVDLQVLEEAERIGRTLSAGSRMVPVLLTFDLEGETTGMVALTDPSVSSREEAERHLQARQPPRWAIVRTGELEGRFGLVTDVGDCDVVFVHFLPLDPVAPRVQTSVLPSPQRRPPTLKELELTRRLARWLVESDESRAVLAWDLDRAPRWISFTDLPADAPVGPRLDAAIAHLAGVSAFAVGAKDGAGATICVGGPARVHVLSCVADRVELLRSLHRRHTA